MKHFSELTVKLLECSAMLQLLDEERTVLTNALPSGYEAMIDALLEFRLAKIADINTALILISDEMDSEPFWSKVAKNIFG